MNVYFPNKVRAKLEAKLEFVKGKGSLKLVEAICDDIDDGNTHDRLGGLDRHGRPQPPVKKRRGKYAGAGGPPLAPFGVASRVISAFRCQRYGKAGSWRIVAGWERVASKSGVPFLPFLDKGVADGGHSAGVKKKAGGVFARAFRALSGGVFRRALSSAGRATGLGGWKIPPRPFFGLSPRTWAKVNKRIADFKTSVKKAK